MDVSRIRQEIANAKQQFEYVECHYDTQGNPYVMVALQTSASRIYTLSVSFPDNYPYSLPSVYVRKPTLKRGTGHMFSEDKICYQHSSTWNPGRHDLSHVIARSAKWLNKYEVWLKTNNWPGKEIKH